MPFRRFTLFTAFSLSLLFLCRSPAGGQVNRTEADRLAVDVLTLHVGGDVRGIVIERSVTGIQMAVRRAWLAEHQPDLLRIIPADADVAQQRRELVERIDQWLEELRTGSPVATIAAHEMGTKGSPKSESAELLRVLKAERNNYREYIDDPHSLPPGEGSTKARQNAYEQLASRLDQWIDELEGSPLNAASGPEQIEQNRDELIRILKKERENYAQPAAEETAKSKFIRLALSRADVHLVFAQSEPRRKLAIAAFREGLNDVEATLLADLQQQLEARDIDWQHGTSDGAQLLAETASLHDRAWAARRAIYEYQFLRRLDFQGTGNVLVQTGQDAPPPKLAQLMQGLLLHQQQAALGDLLQEPIFTGLDFGGVGVPPDPQGGIKEATRTADRLGVCGVRITLMTPELARRQSTVEDRFLAKMPDGSWETIWSATETISARDARQNDLDRIKQDPQIKQIVGLAEGLGLGGGQLDVALQFGAATMNAQQATDDEFYQFRDKYTQRLDGPPLNWR